MYGYVCNMYIISSQYHAFVKYVLWYHHGVYPISGRDDCGRTVPHLRPWAAQGRTEVWGGQLLIQIQSESMVHLKREPKKEWDPENWSRKFLPNYQVPYITYLPHKAVAEVSKDKEL